MADPTKTEAYYFSRVGSLAVRPISVKFQATFSSGTATKDTTRRRSDPSVAIAGSSGTYTITGIPTGQDGFVRSVTLDPGSNTPAALAIIAVPRSYNAQAGTMTIVTLEADTAAAVLAPADGARLYVELEVETGVY